MASEKEKAPRRKLTLAQRIEQMSKVIERAKVRLASAEKRRDQYIKAQMAAAEAQLAEVRKAANQTPVAGEPTSKLVGRSPTETTGVGASKTPF